MKIKMYILGLLKFKNDNIVFNTEELESISQAIDNCLQKKGFLMGRSKKIGGFYVYSLDPKKLPIEMSKSSITKINLAEIGFYHHRVIVNLALDLEDSFYALREIREGLKQFADKIICCCVKKEIDKLIQCEEVREEGEIKFFYTYPLIIVENGARKCETIPFSEQTNALCFEIVEPCWHKLFGRKHIMRISVPSTILYTQGEAGNNLLRDIINAIYLRCLYEKMSRDKKSGTFKNAIDVDINTELMEYTLDKMGGRTVDVHNTIMSNIRYILAFLALLVGTSAFLWSILQLR